MVTKMGGKTIWLSRIVLRYIVYNIMLTIFIAQSWIDPNGSILHNVGGGFIVWFVPQIVAYFFFRGRDFGIDKRWLVQGVVFAILLTVFLNQHWIDPLEDYIVNVVSGLVLYISAYLTAHVTT